jgi:hypothetical protein
MWPEAVSRPALRRPPLLSCGQPLPSAGVRILLDAGSKTGERHSYVNQSLILGG